MGFRVYGLGPDYHARRDIWLVALVQHTAEFSAASFLLSSETVNSMAFIFMRKIVVGVKGHGIQGGLLLSRIAMVCIVPGEESNLINLKR